VVVPGIDAARAGATATPRTGAVAVALEDGGVLVVGGDGGVEPAARYRPDTRRFEALDLAPDGLGGVLDDVAGQGAALLPDGSVLLVGGRDDGGVPLDTAAVFRPSGDTAFTGAVTVTPGGGEAGPLIALDPATVALDDDYVIAGGDGAAEIADWVVIGGMRPRQLDLEMTFDGTEVAIVFGFVDAEHFDAVMLSAGGEVRWIRRDASAFSQRCVGEAISAGELGPATRATLHVRDGAVRVELGPIDDRRLVLDCAIEPRAGLVGVAPVDPVTLSTISVSR
jgi:hypothetical protein